MTEGYSETEKARIEALSAWFKRNNERNACFRASSRLFDMREDMKCYAEIVSIHAPELSGRFKDVRREIYEIAKELQKKGEEKDFDASVYYNKAIADDPEEVRRWPTPPGSRIRWAYWIRSCRRPIPSVGSHRTGWRPSKASERGNDELIEQVGSALREVEGKAREMMDIIRCTKNTMNMLAGRRAEE